MQQAKDTILKVIALIENSEAWTQGASARNKKGTRVSPYSQRACRWCTLGALDKVTADHDSWMEATRRIREAMRSDMGVSISEFNDNHTHAEVLALLRKAAYAY
jgi:hypothetical protein